MGGVAGPYRPAFPWRHGHISTIYAAKFRHIPLPPLLRERLELPDGDFMDLDWWRSSGEADKVAVLDHGGGGRRVPVLCRHGSVGRRRLAITLGSPR